MTHLEHELDRLKKEINEMGTLVQGQLKKSIEAFTTLDMDLAHQIIFQDRRVNAEELKIDRDCENIFAIYSPVAVDLRFLLAVLKINTNLERTGDIAEGIAKMILDTDNTLGWTFAYWQCGLMKRFD